MSRRARRQSLGATVDGAWRIVATARVALRDARCGVRAKHSFEWGGAMRWEAGVVERSRGWSGRDRRSRITCLLSTFAVAIVISAGAGATDPADARKIFNHRCTACHTFGRGVKVGPDLKGVTS